MKKTTRLAFAIVSALFVTNWTCSISLADDLPELKIIKVPVKIRATEQQNETPAQSAVTQVPTTNEEISKDIEVLSKQILVDIIDLQKFNLLYRINAAPQGRWKGWRYFASQESNLALTEAAIIVSIGERGEHIHGKHYERTSENKIGNGNALLGAIAQIIAGSGSGIELAINKYHSYDSKKKGYSPNQARDVAIKLVSDIDKKLAAREELIRNKPSAQGEFAQMQILEGKVLVDFRDLCVSEFERYHASEVKTLAQQNSFYMLDMAKNAVGTVGSFYLAYAALNHARALNLPGGILTTISGAMIASNAVTSRLLAQSVEKADHADLAKHGLVDKYAGDVLLSEDYDHLRNFCKNHQVYDRRELQNLVARLNAYDCNCSYEVSDLQRSLSEQKRGNRTAYQNIFDSILVGSTKTEVGILTTIAGAKYPKDGMHSNSLLFAGAVGYLPGITYGLGENIRIQLASERRRAIRRKNHETTAEIVQVRLAQLNQMKTKL